MFQCLCDSWHLTGQSRVNSSWSEDARFTRALSGAEKYHSSATHACNSGFLHFWDGRTLNKKEGKKRRGRKRGSGRFMKRTENRETAGKPDHMGVREGEACFALAQWWGRTRRVVHQIFMRASEHSLELHYGTKAAENILEEQLNKMWLIYRPWWETHLTD